MKITVNDKNEVIGFVNTGGLPNSLDVDDNNVRIKFKEEFEPRKFVSITANNHTIRKETDRSIKPTSRADLSDEELAGWFGYRNRGGTSKRINNGISSTKRYVNTTVD
uniref:Uncharacterized protein n=1 Tax=Dubowvirus dv11 TaxID=12360 RepID=Q8W5T2_9CAUD|nr:unknown [Dubowvirus dv11]